MSVQAISGVFGVPLALINSMDNATFSNTETLINHWLATGLGFTVSLIEKGLENIFECSPNELLDLDEKILLRANFKDRIDALGSAVSHGIYSPNEVRQIEGLPPVDGGDKPYLQQQMIQLGENPLATNDVVPPTPPLLEPPTPNDSSNPNDSPMDAEQSKNIFKSLLIGKMNHA
jgi:hypothetical protein